jgi:uncharacterized coiled-coil DUF342 family protein
VAITEQQLDKVNEVKIERDACYEAMYVSNETIDSLASTIEKMEQLSNRQRELTEQRDSIIEKQIETNQKLLHTNKMWKWGTGATGLVGLIIGILITL